MSTTVPLSAPEGTRAALIAAAMRLFGQQGFAATSTRAIATLAGTNVASISYHFGSKDGLRQACADEFSRQIRSAMATPPAHILSADAAHSLLHAAVRRMAEFMLGSPAAGDMVPFLIRELGENGPGLTAIYTELMEPTHRRFCALWASITGQAPESDAVKLSVFSTIGQIFYFRMAGPLVARRMGWAHIGAAEIDAISTQIQSNLDALLVAAERP